MPNPKLSALQIKLFGPLEVLVDGQPLPPMRSRRALSLLALMTLRHGKPVQRDWLAHTLWPDTEKERAMANLRTLLSELRKALGAEGDRIQSPDRQTLLLVLDGAEVDLVAFDEAIAHRRTSELEHAVSLYTGPLLEGSTEEWVFQERSLRERECLESLQQLADSALERGEYPIAIAHYQRAVILDPWWETARRGWMEALAASGDTNEALLVYRDYRDLLREMPGAVPDEQTHAVYRRLRSQARSRPPTGIASDPRIPTSVGVVGHLPHPLTELIGREDEVIEVVHQLRKSRLVTLTGVGGIGKTRVAIAVARQVATGFRDGVWLVALESVIDGNLVVRQVASSLGVREAPGQELLRCLADHLKGKRLLLVLDNCEHLLEAVVSVVDQVLKRAEAVHVLVTSREALRMIGEATWSVPALSVPELPHLPAGRSSLLRAIQGYESVTLFVERAQATRKEFLLTRENAMAVAEICARLEGIPLAIELAAARIKTLSIEQIAVRLENQLMLLAADGRLGRTRQQTLRATLDWSYALLSITERVLLARLSVFAGGWTLDAADMVGSGVGIQPDQILDLLTGLAEKSLVVFEEREGIERYRLPEIVRQYAAEHLESSGEVQQVRAHHRNWLVLFAEEAEKQLRGAEQGSWLNRLDEERHNLRSTLEWDERGTAADHTRLRLATALRRFWYVRGHFAEGLDYLTKALDQEIGSSDVHLLANALNGVGTLAFSQGDHATGRAFFSESLRLQRELNDLQGVGTGLNNLANIAYSEGDYLSAGALYTESLQIRRDLEDHAGVITTLMNLGHVSHSLSDFAAAEGLFNESLKLSGSLGDTFGTAWSMNALGKVMQSQGHFGKAMSLLQESGRLFEEVKDQRGITSSLKQRGDLLARTDGGAAWELYRRSFDLSRELGDQVAVAECLHKMADLMLARERPQVAVLLWAVAEALEEKLGVSMPPVDGLEDYAKHLGETRDLLGESAFGAIWKEGGSMDLDEVAANCLSLG